MLMIRSVTHPSRCCHGIQCGIARMSIVASTGSPSIPRRSKSLQARIDWSKPAQVVHDRVRGLSPFPGAFFLADLGKGAERVKVLRTALAEGAAEPGTLIGSGGAVACGDGAVRLLQVQRAGRGIVSAEEFLRGARLRPGSRLP